MNVILEAAPLSYMKLTMTNYANGVADIGICMLDETSRDSRPISSSKDQPI
jgi:hypothetical protein